MPSSVFVVQSSADCDLNACGSQLLLDISISILDWETIKVVLIVHNQVDTYLGPHCTAHGPPFGPMDSRLHSAAAAPLQQFRRIISQDRPTIFFI